MPEVEVSVVDVTQFTLSRSECMSRFHIHTVCRFYLGPIFASVISYQVIGNYSK